ncbi:1-acyl-sn-glycerol-3-phosphate acyltransferase delta [Trichonephila inaurata madagascariensis]|uniref:1-acyl-sn-glycerol-3-phosphate acyltransferase delta n=1 Tax=Trichonephila inaurata madagascariensis TaxID=2747483 RepID=A0A8X6IV47_9ARAC|nr:1-acyl-sn-glycerol-3-phosphate acyltransferase delta [Trichonephila inaurata madagascariensis]
MHPLLKLFLKGARIVGLFMLASHMTIVFLFSGLLCNLLQFIIYVALYNRNRKLYRKLNYYLIYFSWSQILAVYEWRSNSNCKLYGDEESIREFGKEHCIIVMNHKYDIDWVVCWFITNYLKMLANSKTCAKKQLRNVPVIGWGWIFAEMIFLERNWGKDKLVMGEKLDKLVDYEDPIMLLFFCEGTRFTPEKHKASMEFAKSRNLPLLQHHLCPRTSGFNFIAKYCKNKIPYVYNIQLGFPESDKKPTFSNLLRGYSFSADMFLERIPLTDVPTDSDEATSKWLHDLYQKKDKLMDDYLKTQKFPGKCVEVKRSYRSLINSVFWAIFIGVPWLYTIYLILTTGNIFLTSIVSSIFIFLFTVMFYMVRQTKASKGSSYGTNQKPSEEAKNGTFAHGHVNGEVAGDVIPEHKEGEVKSGEESNSSQNCEQTNNNLVC